MKICIVIQSESFRDSAGMRIRYDRFRECLSGRGVTLDAVPCADLAAAKEFPHDVYIFCKTFDTMALLLARQIRAAGKTVGQDLFDDYFSQVHDPRLQRFREWMRDMREVTDFAICSTPRMVEVMRPYLPDIAISAVDDPIMGFDPFLFQSRADAKIKQAQDERTLRIVWFGIGDNPFFNVGISDLANCEPELARMEQLGWKVQLQIVTNRRPLEKDGAEALRRFGVDFELVEWSEEAERCALSDAVIALLPVNGQSFSRAKSLNRAVTALNHGCQILSLGYPLYNRLGAFVYRSTTALLGDIETRTCKVGSARMDALMAKLSEVANPIAAAEQFAAHARSALHARQVSTKAKLVCLFHGRKTNIALHKAVSAMGGLSVRTIFTEAAWNFPVRFDQSGSEVTMRVTPALAKRFKVPVRDPGATVRIGDLQFVEVDLATLGIAPLRLFGARPAVPLHDYALYQDVFGFARDCCRAVFGEIDLLISESAPMAPRPLNLRESSKLSASLTAA